MKNNQNNQVDLIVLDETECNTKIPFIIGLTSLSLLIFAPLSDYLFVNFDFSFISFGLAFVLSILGIISVSRFKKKYSNFSVQQKNKLKLGKLFSLITLIISSLIILAGVSLIILIGNQGFGR